MYCGTGAGVRGGGKMSYGRAEPRRLLLRAGDRRRRRRRSVCGLVETKA